METTRNSINFIWEMEHMQKKPEKLSREKRKIVTQIITFVGGIKKTVRV